jgi:uncharacterized membrane protein
MIPESLKSMPVKEGARQMKAYLLKRLKQVLRDILWLISAAVLVILVHSLRNGKLTVNSYGLFFLKLLIIGLVIVEVIKLISWLFKRYVNPLKRLK